MITDGAQHSDLEDIKVVCKGKIKQGKVPFDKEYFNSRKLCLVVG